MANKKLKPQEEKNETALIVSETQDLAKPQQDTNFAHESAKILKEIIRQNGWAKRLGGQSEHIQYEGWQTLGKYYSYTVKTYDSQPIEIAGVSGFKAKAVVVNEITGVEIGSAEAYCMRDEANWRAKPTFQLASMAQTRAGSKALRQILGFVVALAGYSPTPAEEMTGDEFKKPMSPSQMRATIETDKQPANIRLITDSQRKFIFDLVEQKGKTKDDLDSFISVAVKKDSITKLTMVEASKIIEKLNTLPDAKAPTTVKKTPVEKEEELNDAEFEQIDLAINLPN